MRNRSLLHHRQVQPVSHFPEQSLFLPSSVKRYTKLCSIRKTDSFVPSGVELTKDGLVSVCGLEEQSSFPGQDFDFACGLFERSFVACGVEERYLDRALSNMQAFKRGASRYFWHPGTSSRPSRCKTSEMLHLVDTRLCIVSWYGLFPEFIP